MRKMIEQVICDSCGKEDEDCIRCKIPTHKNISVLPDKDILVTEDIDLCPNCAEYICNLIEYICGFKKVTNGDVMKMIFPKAKIEKGGGIQWNDIDYWLDGEVNMPKPWWNDTYVGGEGK